MRQIVAATGLHARAPSMFGWADTEDNTWDRASEQRDVEWVGGAFMMLRGNMLDKIGGLSEDFFFYGEDVEFCHRVRRAGYRCRYDARVSITHLGGGSSDPDALPPIRKARMIWKARYAVQRKCYGRLAMGAVWLVDLVTWTLRYVGYGLMRRGSSRYAQARQNVGLLVRVGDVWQ